MVFVFHRLRPILDVGNIRSSVLGRHPIVVLFCCYTLLHVLLTGNTTESVVDVVEAFPVSSPSRRARIPTPARSITTASTTLSATATNIMLEEGTNGATAVAAAAAATITPGVVETTTTVGDTVGPSLGSVLFLAYVVFSLGAGIKYIVVDGWRPKL